MTSSERVPASERNSYRAKDGCSVWDEYIHEGIEIPTHILLRFLDIS